MSVDILQEKIRKSKNPVIVDFALSKADLPPHLLQEEQDACSAYRRFCRELLNVLKGTVPGIRFHMGAFCAMGLDGLAALADTLREAKELGFYVLLDIPTFLTAGGSEGLAESCFGEDALYPCDGAVLEVYAGSDAIRPFLPYCKEAKKDLYCVVRTSNKSAPELQDLLTGTRLVHAAAADLMNRFGGDAVGKNGYSRIGVLAGASSAQSLKNLRAKYPRMFLLLDDLDYVGCNAKICSEAFDRLGRGAAVCAGTGITCAWRMTESDGTDYAELAAASAERVRKNVTRYLTIL